ncbi:anti-sigma factor [Nocardioides dongxiaopingii]|uniref:anti-sigma factor n=1 Tax=Nocardioides sp. S-1144 TaxID=2582905 RepID=UPI00110EFACE|nr:anti-sigma factor [Nocardioides sp. S-1144]QCW49560.1 anti-sigma factor [Nocardioides sp. S-1144]
MTDLSESEGHADLVGLVRGELGTAEVLDASDHLATCTECRGDLVDTVVGHALLARSARTEEAAGRPLGEPALPAPTLPAPAPRDASWLRRTSPRALLAAAVVVLVVAVGSVVALTVGRSDPGVPTARVVSLAPITDAATNAVPGEARIRRDGRTAELTIVTDGLPVAGGGEFYQAWLLDPDTNKMLALGPLSGGTSRFQVDDDLLTAYSAVDVSLEADDGDPQHAATSVLRGSY